MTLRPDDTSLGSAIAARWSRDNQFYLRQVDTAKVHAGDEELAERLANEILYPATVEIISFTGPKMRFQGKFCTVEKVTCSKRVAVFKAVSRTIAGRDLGKMLSVQPVGCDLAGIVSYKPSLAKNFTQTTIVFKEMSDERTKTKSTNGAHGSNFAQFPTWVSWSRRWARQDK